MLQKLFRSPITSPPVFRVAVIDNFSRKTVDVDGDGIFDLPHGVMVERFIRANAPETAITRFSMNRKDTWYGDILQAVRRILKMMDHGVQFDAVNLSFSHDLRYELAEPEKSVSIDVNTLRTDLLSMLKRLCRGRRRDMWLAVHQLARIAKKNVPVYVGAGNSGKEIVNAYTLGRGVISVGATNSLGQKMPRYADHALVSRFDQGIFSVAKVVGGFDINGDGTPDVRDAEVSGKTSILQAVLGRPLADVMNDPSFQGSSGIFSLDDLLAQQAIPQELYDQYRYRGNFIYLQENKVVDVFTTDGEGRLVLDPDASHQSNVVNTLMGTSFSTAWAVGCDLKKRRA